MSLVDELLADFSPSVSPSESREGTPGPDEEGEMVSGPGSITKDSLLRELETTGKLMEELKPLIEKVKMYSEAGMSESAEGNLEDNPEYRLLVSANTLSVDVTTEIVNVHKFVKEKYYTRFPELESLVANPIDYVQAVKIIGNDVKSVSNKTGQLGEFLQAATVMVITVSSSTTTGKELDEMEMKKIKTACDILLYLDAGKREIVNYVSTRMSLFAPNTAALVGPQTAAQLFGVAGGLNGLSKMPSCNIAALGSKRDTTSIGLGHTGIRQQGFLYHCQLVQSVPMDLRKNAMRILAGKVVLAARIDRVHENMDGSAGRKLETEVLEKLEKLGEPPSNKGPKPLPAPDDKPSKKRGGRRIRKYKEKFAMTDLRKAQNRMKFGEADSEDYVTM
ncbi:hypothetical protein V1511DRAFT_503261 [Dipodascopsis uninucleata]